LVKRLVRIEGDEVECGWTSDINASIRKHPGRQASDAEMWGVPFRKRSRIEILTMICGGNAGGRHPTRHGWFKPPYCRDPREGPVGWAGL